MIYENGDVMQDAAMFYTDRARRPEMRLPKRFILCTVHRAENTDDAERLKGIFKALELISQNVQVVLPLHPRTRAKLQGIGYDLSASRICFIDPVGYLEMVYLLKNCEMVMCDSGGLQKEAYFFGKNCVTLRDETEWVELVENGFNVLAGAVTDEILAGYNEMITKQGNDFQHRLYGNGDAGEQILKVLREHFLF